MTSRTRGKPRLGTKDDHSKLDLTISELEQAITEWQVLEADPHPLKREEPLTDSNTKAKPKSPHELILKLKQQLENFD